MIPEIIAAIIGALLWFTFEFLFRVFAPKNWYFPLVKFERKIRLRNEKYPLNVLKAYRINSDKLEPEIIRDNLENNVKNIFSKQNIKIISKNNDLKLSTVMERSNLIISLDAIILPKGEYPGENYRVIVKQSAKIKFNAIEKDLTKIFWNLTKFYEGNLNILTQTSDSVDVEIDAGNLKVYAELFEKIGSNIIGENVKMHQKEGHTIIKISDTIEPEFAEKIREILALGSI